MENILEIKGVSKSFGSNRVLDKVDMTVRKGEVYGLCGENGAGKSTLMNVVAGIHKRDEGTIIFDGKEINFSSPREAVFNGIAFVHQELALCQHLTVGENMWMWNIPRNGDMINKREMYRKTDEVLARFNTEFNARSRVGSLSVAQQQIAEIAKALSMNAKMIILDEPSSSITDSESENLFRIVRELRDQGIGFVLISHRMNEIFSYCDRVTVLRDGNMVMTENVSDVEENVVINSMVGRELTDFFPPKSTIDSDEELLRVENYTGKGFENINFTLKKGQILGFSGLIGAGRSEVMRALCGLGGYKSGDLYVKGEKIINRNYGEAIARKICYVSEDRKKNGVFKTMTIQRNMVVAILDKIKKGGLLNKALEQKYALEQIEAMKVKCTGPKQKVGSLSGGNQQKVVIGKWMNSDPEIIIFDEPTKGIDVGAKSQIHFMMRELCDKGIGVILISSEMPKVIGMSDEVVVMHEGHQTGSVSGDDITESNLIMLSSGKEIA